MMQLNYEIYQEMLRMIINQFVFSVNQTKLTVSLSFKNVCKRRKQHKKDNLPKRKQFENVELPNLQSKFLSKFLRKTFMFHTNLTPTRFLAAEYRTLSYTRINKTKSQKKFDFDQKNFIRLHKKQEKWVMPGDDQTQLKLQEK